MCLEFKYGDEKVLGTQPYTTYGSAFTHCVSHPNSIEVSSNRFSYTHTHTHTHTHTLCLSLHASSIQPSIHLSWHNIHFISSLYTSHCRRLASIGNGSRKTVIAIAGPRLTTCRGDNSHARKSLLEGLSR